jgi:hypothetical protein
MWWIVLLASTGLICTGVWLLVREQVPAVLRYAQGIMAQLKAKPKVEPGAAAAVANEAQPAMARAPAVAAPVMVAERREVAPLFMPQKLPELPAGASAAPLTAGASTPARHGRASSQREHGIVGGDHCEAGRAELEPA